MRSIATVPADHEMGILGHIQGVPKCIQGTQDLYSVSKLHDVPNKKGHIQSVLTKILRHPV